MAGISQSGLITMREKLRSVTLPQAAIILNIGFGASAKAGYPPMARAVAPSHSFVFRIVSIAS